eukprot:269485-Chlamydomonas_euryale.AAC.1
MLGWAGSDCPECLAVVLPHINSDFAAGWPTHPRLSSCRVLRWDQLALAKHIFTTEVDPIPLESQQHTYMHTHTTAAHARQPRENHSGRIGQITR